MAQQKKARRVGRPKLPEGEAMGRIVPVRFAKDDIRAMELAAHSREKSLSDWVRTALFLEAKKRYKGCVIELATRSEAGGEFIAYGWITTVRDGRKPIPFEAPGRWMTKEAAIEAGIAWCKERIDLPPRSKIHANLEA